MEFEKFNIRRLRSLLKEKNLPTNGPKSVLVSRLRNFGDSGIEIRRLDPLESSIENDASSPDNMASVDIQESTRIDSNQRQCEVQFNMQQREVERQIQLLERARSVLAEERQRV